MFTGIVQTVAQITQVKPFDHGSFSGLNLTVHCDPAFLNGVQLGDSIAIQGACMTVTELQPASFSVDVSHESLSKTVGLSQTGAVNLEKALSLATPLGGHLVTGHVDGLGHVAHIEQVGESWQMVITSPLSLAPFFAVKGSAVVNGVSLTVNTVTDHAQGCDLSFNLIPHTWQNTSLCKLATGDAVNLEIDLIARYLARMTQWQAKQATV